MGYRAHQPILTEYLLGMPSSKSYWKLKCRPVGDL